MVSESRIVRLDKVLYLCTVILNYSNYGTRQETIKQQDKVRDVVVGGRYQFTPLVIFRQVGDTIVTALVFKTH